MQRVAKVAEHEARESKRFESVHTTRKSLLLIAAQQLDSPFSLRLSLTEPLVQRGFDKPSGHSAISVFYSLPQQLWWCSHALLHTHGARAKKGVKYRAF